MSRIAVGQMCSTACHATNLAAAETMCSAAVAAGAQLLCLPEAFSFIGSSAAETVAQAEPLTGPRMASYRALSKRHGLWLSLGGYHESGAPGGRVFNTHVILDAAGETKATYRKAHLFDVDIPGGATLLESRSTAPGPAEFVACDTVVGRVGLTTCYDLRFPEVYAALAKDGCEIMLVPSAFTVPTGKAHWHLLLRARAVEAQAYVVAAAQAGPHNEKRESYGHALAVDPWGTVVADAGPHDPAAPAGAATVVTCDLDLDKVRAIRQKMPIQAHRRHDVMEAAAERFA